jgi:hypothetical protein
MGKPTGFLEHSRNKVKDRAPLERIKDFEEFTLKLDEQERKGPGSPLHGLRCPFLSLRLWLSRGQPDPRMERPGLSTVATKTLGCGS